MTLFEAAWRHLTLFSSSVASRAGPGRRRNDAVSGSAQQASLGIHRPDPDGCSIGEPVPFGRLFMATTVGEIATRLPHGGEEGCESGRIGRSRKPLYLL